MFIKLRSEYTKTDGTTGNSNASDWWKFLKAELHPYPNIHSAEYKRFEAAVNGFNIELEFYLNKIIEKANLYLHDNFKEDVSIKIEYQKCLYNPKYSDIGVNKAGRDRRTIPPKIILKTKFKNSRFENGEIELDRPHTFLNEAKLTSIALAIRFAIIDEKLVSDAPKILVLDDLLISLDMSNRRTVIDIIFRLYTDFQIIFMTHDRNLYHYMQQHIRNRGLKGDWKTIEMYQSALNGIRQPEIFDVGEKHLLEKAEYHLLKHDYPACGIYLRKECEAILDRILPDTSKYEVKQCHFTDIQTTQSTTLNDKLKCLKDFCKKEGIDYSQFEDLIIHKSVILNTLAHNDIASPLYRSELELALKTIEKLSKIKREQELKKSNKNLNIKLIKQDGSLYTVIVRTKDKMLVLEDPNGNKRISHFLKLKVERIIDNGNRTDIGEDMNSLYNVLDKHCAILQIEKPNLIDVLFDRLDNPILLN